MSTYDLRPPRPPDGEVDARFGQLTFTSFDGLGGAGWQVKDSRSLSVTDIELLRAGIDAQIDTGMDLPRFPAPAEVDRFPRRLVFDAHLHPPAGGRVSAWWHHAPAGLDGSGRPGNVFAHILLDRGATRPGADGPERWSERRPIDWWRSPGWLTPFGPEAVRDCSLPFGEPGPGESISASGVVDFLLDFDDYRRLSVLRVLLDACAAALAGGPPVVLTTADTDKAAQWIAAVSYLTSPATSRWLSFSTLERPASLASRLDHGIRLCCAPAGDHERLDDRNRSYVLIADDLNVLTGDLDGEPHQTAAGDRVAVTEWSALARVVLADEHIARRALDDIARIGSAAPASPTLPAWPLAMAVAADEELLADGVPIARRVVPNTPDGTSAEQLAAARRFVAGHDLDVGQAWEMVRSAGRDGRPLSDMAAQVLGIYVTLAVADLDRLARPGGPELPELGWRNREWITASVLRSIESAIDDLPSHPDDPRAPLAVLGLGVLAHRLEVLDEFADRLIFEVERSVVPLLIDPGGVDFVASAGAVPDAVQAGIIRPAIAPAIESRVPGQGLELPVLTWLYPDGPPPAPRPPGDRLQVEVAYQSWLADHERFRDQRALALLGALGYQREHLGGPGTDELARTFAAPDWSLQELSQIESSTPNRLPSRFFEAAIKTGPSGADLDRLLGLLDQRKSANYYQRYGTHDLAELRRNSQRAWWLGADVSESLDHVLAGGIAGLRSPEVPFDGEAAETLRIAMLLAVARAVHLDDVEALIDAGAVSTGLVSARVLTALVDGVGRGVNVADLAAAAVLGEPRAPARALRDSAYGWAARNLIDTVDGRAPVLRQAVVEALGRHPIRFEDLYPLVRARTKNVLRRAGLGALPTYTSVDKFTQTWLRAEIFGERRFGRWR